MRYRLWQLSVNAYYSLASFLGTAMLFTPLAWPFVERLDRIIAKPREVNSSDILACQQVGLELGRLDNVHRSRLETIGMQSIQ